MGHVNYGGWDFYLAKKKSRLGLVVIHEIFGYDAYIESVAEELAKAGFAAAAIDLFRGRRPKSIEEGRAIRNGISDKDLADGISKGAELLRSNMGARKVGSMGFCMGGGVALQGACDAGLDFCVDYYGSIPDENGISKLTGPVLLILGSEDERVTPWAFEKFLPAAVKYKKRVEVQLYPKAKHAFHRPGWEGHNPEAAKDAWEQTKRFLSQIP
jgi:carboxymethylenebutenolidase